MSSTPTQERISELTRRREPFVHARVVRAQEPTSAHPGDTAIVHADGTIEGFVGGHCATGAVRTAALEAMATGVSTLLRVLPDDAETFPETPGARVVVNPCLSGGAMEIFLEPVLPAPLTYVAGDSPIARAVADLAEHLGYEVVRASAGEPRGAVAAIVAQHGGDEPKSIRAALDAGVPFIGLVASTKRGTALLDEMRLTPEERARVHSPVGLWIGARTASEIAVSILAEIVKAHRLDGAQGSNGVAAGPTDPLLTDAVAPAAGAAPTQAIDPICGMTVTIGPDTVHLELEGEDFWFCCPGCRDKYAAEH
jgi:xanthine dehydrogenase accessory factor